MKSCIGTCQLPHDKIKYNSSWCPLCALSLRLENEMREKENLRKCIRYMKKEKGDEIRKNGVYETWVCI